MIVLKIVTGKSKGMRFLGGPRCRWEDNIRIELKKIGVNKMNFINLAQDRDC